MNSVSARRARFVATAAAVTAASLVLVGCSGSSDKGSGDQASTGSTITIGTTDSITALDPAGSYDQGSQTVQTQVFPYLFDTPYGSPDPKPSIAVSGTFVDPNTFEVKLKPGLKWANGDTLDANDVKFTFDRQQKIGATGADGGNGPSSLLANLDSTSVKDDLTVDFHLKVANDQTFEQVLTSPVGPIVDDQVFSPTAITSDDAIVKADAFAGQYTITSYKVNQLVEYKPYKGYQGLNPAPKNSTVIVKYYTDPSNLKLDVQSGAIDVAYRSLSSTDIADLRNDKSVKVIDGPGGEIRYIVFNFDTQPYGAKTKDADPKKALAVRQAVADLIDRKALSDLYKGTYTPLYSYVPDGLTGANTSLKSLYGDGSGGPSTDAAKKVLADAGVTGPVTLDLQYTGEHYGPQSSQEYGLIKNQLESSGLFKVNIAQTEYVQYTKDRTSDVYPEYQLGWFPDYSDADNYLSPFFPQGGFLHNHYDNPAVDKLITQQIGETDASKRADIIGQIQDAVAKDLPTIPMLQGAQVAVVGKDVKGALLDASFKFRYATLYK